MYAVTRSLEHGNILWLFLCLHGVNVWHLRCDLGQRQEGVCLGYNAVRLEWDAKNVWHMYFIRSISCSQQERLCPTD